MSAAVRAVIARAVPASRLWKGVNALVAFAFAVGLFSAGGGVSPLDGGTPAELPQQRTVTLPTGDVVVAEVHEDGRIDAAVDFAPRDHGREPGYVQTDDGEGYYVIPDDAGVEEGWANREDFNIVPLLGNDVRAPSEAPQSEPVAEEEHTLTVIGHHRDGRPFNGNYVNFTIMNMENRSLFADQRPTFDNGKYEATVPAGTYAVVGIDRQTSQHHVVFLGDPAVEVFSDTTVVMDAREAEEITVDVQTHDVWGREVTLAYMVIPESGNSYKNTHGMLYYESGAAFPPSPRMRIYATGTDDPVEVGRFALTATWMMDAPARRAGGKVDEAAPAVDTAVEYFLPFTVRGPIPHELNFVIDEEFTANRLASMPVRIHSNLDGEYYREARNLWLVDPQIEGSFARLNYLESPTERIEYVTAGEIIRQQVYGDEDYQSVMREPVTAWEPGVHEAKRWFAEPLRPGVMKQHDEIQRSDDIPIPVTRDGDVLNLWMADVLDATRQRGAADSFTNQLLNSTPLVSSGAWPGLRTNFRLLVDGEESPQTWFEARPRGSYTLEPSLATYQLVVETEMSGTRDWAQRESATTTTWTFDSATTPAETILPIIEIDYDLPVDLGNRVPAQGFGVGVELRPQPGGPSMAFSDVLVEHSFDDGQTWSASAVTGSDGSYTASVPAAPDAATTLSLRVSANDTISGSGVEQELIRVAWID